MKRRHGLYLILLLMIAAPISASAQATFTMPRAGFIHIGKVLMASQWVPAWVYNATDQPLNCQVFALGPANGSIVNSLTLTGSSGIDRVAEPASDRGNFTLCAGAFTMTGANGLNPQKHYVMNMRNGGDLVVLQNSFAEVNGEGGADRLSAPYGEVEGGAGPDFLWGPLHIGGPGDDALCGWISILFPDGDAQGGGNTDSFCGATLVDDYTFGSVENINPSSCSSTCGAWSNVFSFAPPGVIPWFNR